MEWFFAFDLVVSSRPELKDTVIELKDEILQLYRVARGAEYEAEIRTLASDLVRLYKLFVSYDAMAHHGGVARREITGDGPHDLNLVLNPTRMANYVRLIRKRQHQMVRMGDKTLATMSGPIDPDSMKAVLERSGPEAGRALELLRAHRYEWLALREVFVPLEPLGVSREISV